MDDQRLLQLLADTQSAAEVPRKLAETQLDQLESDETYPVRLSAIAAHTQVPTAVRQAALSVLRKYIESNWSGQNEDGPVIPIPDHIKEQLRSQLLELATGNEDDRKVRSGASYAVSKIAAVDFPDDWPNLLPTLLHIIPNGSETQLHGALKVLTDLVQDSLSDEQFFSAARDIIRVVYDVAMNPARKANLRAMAVQIFRCCFDILDIVKGEHPNEVKSFAGEAIGAWFPFFLDTIKTTLSVPPKEGEAGYDESRKEPEQWRGAISLKLQAMKTLMKIRTVFPALLLPQSPVLFSAAWADLNLLLPYFQDFYIDHDEQGRLEDADNLPYTLDFLVLEELDFLQSCFRASPVQKELEAQLQANGGIQSTSWVADVMKLAVTYAQITMEEESLWDFDVNVFLAEETAVTGNYTARIACGDLIIKLGEWLHQGAVEGLLVYTRTIFNDANSIWRVREAALFLLCQVMTDFVEVEKPVPANIITAFLEFVDYSVNREDEYLLRARGYLVGGILVQAISSDGFPSLALLDRTINAVNADESEVVKVSCIKAIPGFIRAPGIAATDRQGPICAAITAFLTSQDLSELEESDDLIVTVVETLRAAIHIDPRISIADGSQVLDLLFLLAKHGAANYQLISLVNETFEEIVQYLSDVGNDAYATLCGKVLPSLSSAFDVGPMTDDNALTTLATELLAILAENGPEPLPPFFVGSTMPKLNRLLLNTTEGDILRPGVEAMKFMFQHDHQQMFAWHDETGKSGLEVALIIIDRLLAPTIEDKAASEVGGLAAELVEKAGHDRLGPYLPQLLQAVASRLATAEAAEFIQSLILVFARLSLVGAHDVVEFLSQIQINGQSGLQVVLSKWLENSVNFAGYDEIRQK